MCVCFICVVCVCVSSLSLSLCVCVCVCVCVCQSAAVESDTRASERSTPAEETADVLRAGQPSVCLQLYIMNSHGLDELFWIIVTVSPHHGCQSVTYNSITASHFRGCMRHRDQVKSLLYSIVLFRMQTVSKQLYSIKQRNSESFSSDQTNQQINIMLQQRQIEQRTRLVPVLMTV